MSFASQLRGELATSPITVAAWMARCNAHYYATRDPFGPGGDFVTAPEISQIFGELIGVWLVDLWQRLGSPVRSRLVELGPGRGTLMADIRRVAIAAGWRPDVVFVETSACQAARQLAGNPGTTTCTSLDAVPDDAATLFVVANEFFDALPVRQIVRTADGWRERVVGLAGNDFAAGLDRVDAAAIVPPALAAAPEGSVVELSPAATAIAAAIGARLRARGGAALFVDYGHAGPVTGDTLQAVRRHAVADPFVDPGEVDLTCHVDFTALAVAAGGVGGVGGDLGGVRAWGPVGQGDFLRALGIDRRAAALVQANPHATETVATAVARLTGDAAMGRLFKVMALTTGDLDPAGFA